MKFEFIIPIPSSVFHGEQGHPNTIPTPITREGVTVYQVEDKCIFSTEVATRERGIILVDYLLSMAEERGIDLTGAKLEIDGKETSF